MFGIASCPKFASENKRSENGLANHFKRIDMDNEKVFSAIAEQLSEAHENVVQGKMMRSPGIKVNNKVFAFYYEGQMVFKLGKETDTSRKELQGATWLNPFKNKPPMKAWFVVPFQDYASWYQLAAEAKTFVEQGG